MSKFIKLHFIGNPKKEFYLNINSIVEFHKAFDEERHTEIFLIDEPNIANYCIEIPKEIIKLINE